MMTGDDRAILAATARALLAPAVAKIDQFALLDVYAGGVATETPRTAAIATISAGERVYATADGRSGAEDRFGKPQRTKPFRMKDGSWAGRIVLHDRLGRAPGLRRALDEGEWGRLTIAFPFDDPARFIHCRFANYSTSQLLAHGDQHALMVLGPRGYERVEAGSDRYQDAVAGCKVQVSVYFCLAEWVGQHAEVVFPDGVGAYYRLRFTSRNSLREILAGLRSIGQFTGGKIAGVPFELRIDFREVAGPDGKKRMIPVWTIATRPPETVRLSSGNFAAVMGHALSQGRALMLPAPAEPTIEDAQHEGYTEDLDEVEADGIAVESASDDEIDLIRRGGRCNADYWNRLWHAAVRGSRFQNDDQRAAFLGAYSGGLTRSLTAYLQAANEREAQALVLAVTEQIGRERAEREARGEPPATRPLPVESDAPIRSYEELFPPEDADASAELAEVATIHGAAAPIALPEFDSEAAYTKPQLVDAYNVWSPLLQQLDPSYTPSWAGSGPQRVPFADLDEAVRDVVTRATKLHAEGSGEPA